MEAHSIAFSALYFWIIPAVFLGSIIGVSQTEAAIPRILRRLQTDIESLKLPNVVNLPNERLGDNEKRIFHGGVYSWQPQKCRPSYNLLSYVIVIMGTATGMAVSALVPPDGWDCRHKGEILILVAWLLSALIDVWLSHVWSLKEENQNKFFWCTSLKDFLATIATMGGVITVQMGVFNKCSCYTQSGRAGLALPEMPDTARTLFDRLNTVYPGITFTCIGIELVAVPLFICVRYMDALRTFVQRDDRKSNAIWLWKLLSRYEAVKTRLKGLLPRRLFGLSKSRRTMTGLAEEGGPGDTSESVHLTQTTTGEPETKENDNATTTYAADQQNEPTDSTTRSSGVDWSSRSNTNRPDHRRYNTT